VIIQSDNYDKRLEFLIDYMGSVGIYYRGKWYHRTLYCSMKGVRLINDLGQTKSFNFDDILDTRIVIQPATFIDQYPFKIKSNLNWIYLYKFRQGFTLGVVLRPVKMRKNY
jgi:hypothetical protein